MVQASPHLSPQQIREARQAGEVKSLRWVLTQIQPQYPGRILDVKLSKRKKQPRYIYKIKLLQQDGHIITLYVDANTAEVLRVRSRQRQP